MESRNYGLDIARILSMLGIIMLHLLGQGGVMKGISNNSNNYLIVEWFYILATCSVNIFAMLSGYLCICSKKKTSKRIIELISIVLFYSLIISMIFLIIKHISLKECIIGILPMIKGRYWYIACYIPLALSTPYINKMILSINIQSQKYYLLCLFIFLSILPSINGVDLLGSNQGYSFLWLLYCYCIGAYLRLNENSINNSFKYFIYFILISLILLLVNYKLNITDYFVSYTSPFILIMSIFFLLAIKNVKVNNIFHKLLITFSILSFDVYIIHAHIFIYDYLLKDALLWTNNLSIFQSALILLSSIFVIYVICVIFGCLRSKLYKYVSLDFITNQMDQLFYKDK